MWQTAILAAVTWQSAESAIDLLANILSIVSFAITLYVTRVLWNQDRRFRRLAIWPRLNKRLGECLASIEEARKSQERLNSGLARFRSILVHLREFTEKETRSEIDARLAELERFSVDDGDVLGPRIDILIAKLHGTVESCVDFEIKVPWRHPDDG